MDPCCLNQEEDKMVVKQFTEKLNKAAFDTAGNAATWMLNVFFDGITY